MPPTPGKTPSMSRQASNLSKPGSRQTPRRTPGQGKHKVDIGDPEFEQAMEKQLSSLEKKSTRSSMGGTMPRLGAPDPPKLGSSPKPPMSAPNIEEQNVENEQVTENMQEESSKKEKRKKKKKAENGIDGDNGEYSDDFESGSENDEISKVRDENDKFVQEKFNSVMKALSEASELPNINDVDFDEYMNDQREILKEREKEHTEWMDVFVRKKESVLLRLGIISKRRNDRFTDVCNIACGLMGTPPFPKSTSNRKSSITTRSRSRSREKSMERGRSRSREHSSERSRERSRGRSRERSWDRISKNKSDLLPEIVDVKEELLAAAQEESVTKELEKEPATEVVAQHDKKEPSTEVVTQNDISVEEISEVSQN